MRNMAHVLMVAVSILCSGFAFTAKAADQSHATMLSPIVVYPDDTKVADKAYEGELRTGRSSAKTAAKFNQPLHETERF
jgi:hypothetical protein